MIPLCKNVQTKLHVLNRLPCYFEKELAKMTRALLEEALKCLMDNWNHPVNQLRWLKHCNLSDICTAYIYMLCICIFTSPGTCRLELFYQWYGTRIDMLFWVSKFNALDGQLACDSWAGTSLTEQKWNHSHLFCTYKAGIVICNCTRYNRRFTLLIFGDAKTCCVRSYASVGYVKWWWDKVKAGMYMITLYVYFSIYKHMQYLPRRHILYTSLSGVTLPYASSWTLLPYHTSKYSEMQYHGLHNFWFPWGPAMNIHVYTIANSRFRWVGLGAQQKIAKK